MLYTFLHYFFNDIFVCLRPIFNGTQGLLLALCSGITSGGQGTICSSRNQMALNTCKAQALIPGLSPFDPCKHF